MPAFLDSRDDILSAPKAQGYSGVGHSRMSLKKALGAGTPGFWQNAGSRDSLGMLLCLGTPGIRWGWSCGWALHGFSGDTLHRTPTAGRCRGSLGDSQMQVSHLLACLLGQCCSPVASRATALAFVPAVPPQVEVLRVMRVGSRVAVSRVKSTRNKVESSFNNCYPYL